MLFLTSLLSGFKLANDTINNDKVVDTLNNRLKDVRSLKTYHGNSKDSIEYYKLLVYGESGIKIPKSLPDKHFLVMYNEALKNEIPVKIFFRLIQIESGFDTKSTSNKGAISYMQLLSGTYNKYCRILNLKRNSESNIIIGAFYLKEGYNYWSRKTSDEKYRWALALATYEAGIDNVIRKNGVPKYSKKYVNFIMKKGI
jgi:hypothetical protein